MDLMDHHAFGKYTLILYCEEKAPLLLKVNDPIFEK